LKANVSLSHADQLEGCSTASDLQLQNTCVNSCCSSHSSPAGCAVWTVPTASEWNTSCQVTCHVFVIRCIIHCRPRLLTLFIVRRCWSDDRTSGAPVMTSSRWNWLLGKTVTKHHAVQRHTWRN